MNWKLILAVSCFGLMMGILSVLGLTQGIEPFLWIAIALFSAYVLGSKLPSKQFLAGLLAGFIMGLINGVVQSGFFDTYIANNPEVAQGLNAQPIPGGMQPRILFLISGPMVGFFYGLVVGLFSWGASKIFKKPAAETT